MVGIPYSEFNEEWRKHVNVYYNTQAGQMERLDSLGVRPFSLPGQVVYDVSFSPRHRARGRRRAAEPDPPGAAA